MKKCPNCNSEISNDFSFCTECGKPVINDNKSVEIKKTKIDAMGFVSAFPILVALMVALFYVFKSCLAMSSSPSTDGSVSGLYVIIGIPIGLVMTSLPIIITAYVCIINGIKNNFLITLLVCGMSYGSILMFKFYQNSFVSNYEQNDVFYMIVLVCFIVACVLSLISNIIHLFKKKTE